MKLYNGKEILNNNKRIGKYLLFVIIFSFVLAFLILVLFLFRKNMKINYNFLKIMLVLLSLILVIVDFYVISFYIHNLKKINNFYSYINKGNKEEIIDTITKIEEITMQGVPCLELTLESKIAIFIEKNVNICEVMKKYKFITSSNYVIEVDNYE